MKSSNSFFLPQEVGVIFHHWHNGMDAIYGVGSLAIAGKPISKEYAQEAISLLVNCKDYWTMRSPSKEGSDNIQELAMLIELLERNITLLSLTTNS